MEVLPGTQRFVMVWPRLLFILGILFFYNSLFAQQNIKIHFSPGLVKVFTHYKETPTTSQGWYGISNQNGLFSENRKPKRPGALPSLEPSQIFWGVRFSSDINKKVNISLGIVLWSLVGTATQVTVFADSTIFAKTNKLRFLVWYSERPPVMRFPLQFAYRFFSLGRKLSDDTEAPGAKLGHDFFATGAWSLIKQYNAEYMPSMPRYLLVNDKDTVGVFPDRTYTDNKIGTSVLAGLTWRINNLKKNREVFSLSLVYEQGLVNLVNREIKLVNTLRNERHKIRMGSRGTQLFLQFSVPLTLWTKK